MKYDIHALAKKFVEKYILSKIPLNFTGRVHMSRPGPAHSEDYVYFIFEEGEIREIYDFSIDCTGEDYFNFKLCISPCSFLHLKINPNLYRDFMMKLFQ